MTAIGHRAPSDRTGLSVQSVTVTFGGLVAVDDVSLTVDPGEIVAVIGPSGCGKSTLLRVIAGLQGATGKVSWDGTDIGGLRPDRRGFGLMFQDHALFPHRNVGENVEFGPLVTGMDRRRRAARVAEVLELVDLAGQGDRPVDTLSGGEAQRVALARSLAPSPKLLMLDEPLGSLDRELRERLSTDLRRILTEAGVAAIHVTHDQEEAHAVADRLVVMRRGRIAIDGPSAEVWARPGTVETARFLGHRNILDAATARAFGSMLGSASGWPDVAPGAAVLVHEAALRLVAVDEPGAMAATVSDVRFRGAISQVDLLVEGVGAEETDPVPLQLHLAMPPQPGARLGLIVDPSEVTVLDDTDRAGGR